jgi:hypothetical protein
MTDYQRYDKYNKDDVLLLWKNVFADCATVSGYYEK